MLGLVSDICKERFVIRMRLIWIEFEVISTNLMGYIAENVGNK